MQQTVGRRPAKDGRCAAASAKWPGSGALPPERVAAPSGRRPGAAASSLLLASAAALLTGCAAGDDIVASMALPAAQSTQAGPPGQAGAPAPPLLSPPGGQPGDLVETDRQRAYLNALVADGVHPSSDLHALSIGSYVCQARAAKQTDQAVWDFVLPLVRSDLDAHVNDGVQIDSMAATASQVDAATTGYIRIATERLC